MDDHADTRLELRRGAKALRASARRLDRRADALWLLAGDCDRWGFSDDSAELRRNVLEKRVAALTNRAKAAGLDAKLAGRDDLL